MKIDQGRIEVFLKIWAYLTVFILLSGFLCNRVLNNVGLLMAGLHTLPFLYRAFKKVKGPFFYALFVLIIFPGLWDVLFDGFGFLHNRNTIKWSIIVYPLFFASCLQYKDFIKWVIYLLMACMAVATLYSLWMYVADFEVVNENYGKAKVMKVLAYSDHIRISWATVISMVLAILLFLENKTSINKWFLGGYSILQFVFLHILGSKTGLISLYISLIIIILGYFWKRNRKLSLIFLTVLLLSPVAAYQWVPSFHNRIQFIKYDFSHYVQGDYTEGLSDATRIYSIQGGFDLLSDHPLTGVSFSQLPGEMAKWYSIHAPSLPETQYFIPISEVLVYGAGGGIIGLLLFGWFCVSGINSFKKNIFGLAYFVPLIFSFLYENHLETQSGVFVFGFSLGIFMMLVLAQKNNIRTEAEAGQIHFKYMG